jgi:hypothetical protein
VQVCKIKSAGAEKLIRFILLLNSSFPDSIVEETKENLSISIETPPIIKCVLCSTSDQGKSKHEQQLCEGTKGVKPTYRALFNDNTISDAPKHLPRATSLSGANSSVGSDVCSSDHSMSTVRDENGEWVFRTQKIRCKNGYDCCQVLTTCKYQHSKKEVEVAEKNNGNGSEPCVNDAFCDQLHQGQCWFKHSASQRKAAKQARHDNLLPCPDKFKCFFYSRGDCKYRSKKYWHAK